MPSIAVYVLPLALFAIQHAVSFTEETSRLSGPPRSLGLLLKKRSLKSGVSPSPYIHSEALIEFPSKREDGDEENSDDENKDAIWMWMPAYGYGPMPTEGPTEAPSPSVHLPFSYG